MEDLEHKVEKAKGGDDQAFQDLIEMYKEKLYRIAYLYVKNEHDALDIVHDTVYKAFISIKKLKNNAYFSTWITRILINSAIDFLRKEKKVSYLDKYKESVSRNNYQLEEKIDLFNAIDQLEQKYKTVIILKYYRDLTIQQISEILDCPIGSVKVNLHRALKKLRINLKEVEANE